MIYYYTYYWHFTHLIDAHLWLSVLLFGMGGSEGDSWFEPNILCQIYGVFEDNFLKTSYEQLIRYKNLTKH